MTRQIIILAHSSDAGAHRIASELNGSGVLVLRPEALAAARWSHRVDSRGRAATRLSGPGGLLDSSDVGAVLNRIRYLPVPQFQRAGEKDRDYAGSEFQALVTSWLAAFGDAVVHPVRRHPWLVPNLPPQHWAERATACGLPLSPRTVVNAPHALRLGTPHPTLSAAAAHAESVLVAGDQAAGPLAHEFGARCVATARALGFPLLEFHFNLDGLAAINTHPALLEPWACSLAANLLRTVANRSTQ